jgi:hypothetical protein
MSRVRIAVLALAGLVMLLIVGGVAAYGFYVLDWRCPQQGQILTSDEVERAFEEEGLELAPAIPPEPMPARARLYRHELEDAMVYVLVCQRLCSWSKRDEMAFEPSDGPPQSMRFGVGLTNVQIWTTDADRKSERPLRERLDRIVGEDLAPPPPDRCYIG